MLADHLRYITDNDPMLIEQILRETPFVKEIVEERNEDVAVSVGLKNDSPELVKKINEILASISEEDREKLMNNAIATQVEG